MLSSDQCVIDDEFFFILGNLHLTIIGKEETFNWMVWVSLSESNFQRASKLWETPGRESEPPYFGWLSTELICYPSTLNLKTIVHTQPVGVRSIIELEKTEHQLSIEYKEGISWERVEEFASTIIHKPSA